MSAVLERKVSDEQLLLIGFLKQHPLINECFLLLSSGLLVLLLGKFALFFLFG